MRLDGWQTLIAFVALVAATSFAEATCGDKGGPGYRGRNGAPCPIDGVGAFARTHQRAPQRLLGIDPSMNRIEQGQDSLIESTWAL